MSVGREEEAKRLHLEKGWTYAAIAAHFDVAERTVERWAQKGDWGAQRQAQKVVSIDRPPTQRREPAQARPRPKRGELDEVEVVEGAIASLSAALEEAPPPTLGGIAGGLVRLLEYRRRVCPPTAAELAEQLLELGVTPQEFVAELKKRWQLRA